MNDSSRATECGLSQLVTSLAPIVSHDMGETPMPRPGGDASLPFRDGRLAR